MWTVKSILGGVDGGAGDEQPSAAALGVAEAIRKGARAGRLRRVDVEVVADALEEAGVSVLLPRLPKAQGRWLETVRPRCGSAACGCRRDPAKRHGPYVVLRWRENGRTRQRSLGRLGRAVAPPGLEDELEALQPGPAPRLPSGVLHED